MLKELLQADAYYWTTCTTFSDVKIQDLKVSLELKILNIQPKNSLKYKLLAF